jgi:hypothetical protein
MALHAFYGIQRMPHVHQDHDPAAVQQWAIDITNHKTCCIEQRICVSLLYQSEASAVVAAALMFEQEHLLSTQCSCWSLQQLRSDSTNS